MLKHGILGLLNYSSMTGYQLMEVFRDSLSYFWSAQTSQIYRELQSLKGKGWVEDQVVAQQSRPDKKVFSITEAGQQELTQWLGNGDPALGSRNPMLLKTFFLGELPPERAAEFFREIQNSCLSFSDGAQPSSAVELYQAVLEDPRKAMFWKMTVDFGIRYSRMVNEWAEDCMKEMEAAEHAPADY